MRQRGAPDDAVEVEIVEVDDPTSLDHGAPADAPDDGDTDSRDHARRRVLRWVGAGVIAAPATAVVIVNVAESRAAAERHAALADLPWVLPAMDGPLEEQWRAPGVWVIAETSDVIVTSDMTGSVHLSGIDPSSGEVLWEHGVEDRPENCNANTDWSGWDGVSVDFVPPAPDLFVCVPMSAYGTVGLPAPGTSTTISVLDIVTGAQVSSVALEGDLFFQTVVDGDLLSAVVRPDAGLDVARVDPRDGAVRWTYRSKAGLVPETISGWSMWVDDGLVQISGDVTLAVSIETGAEAAPLAEPDRDAYLSQIPLADGGTVESRYDVVRYTESGRVLDPDGSVRFEFAGSLWRAGQTDGSAAEVLVVHQAAQTGPPARLPRLVGLDVSNGEELWAVADADFSPLLQIDGLVLASSGSSFGAIDVQAGRRLWELPTDQEGFWAAITDGNLVLLPVREAGLSQLAAVELRTGTQVWHMPLPGQIVDVRVLAGGVVLLSTGDEIIAYR